MFHESMISWAYICTIEAIKNGKYIVPFFEQTMGYILAHSMIWATYKIHNLAFHGLYMLHYFINRWALYMYQNKRKNGEYTAPFLSRNMVFI